jgi:hypothetical protein
LFDLNQIGIDFNQIFFYFNQIYYSSYIDFFTFTLDLIQTCFAFTTILLTVILNEQIIISLMIYVSIFKVPNSANQTVTCPLFTSRLLFCFIKLIVTVLRARWIKIMIFKNKKDQTPI